MLKNTAQACEPEEVHGEASVPGSEGQPTCREHAAGVQETGRPRRTQCRHCRWTLWLLSMLRCTIKDHSCVHVEFTQQASKGHQLTMLNAMQRLWGGVHHTFVWEETRPISTGHAMLSQEEVMPIGINHTCREETRPIGTGHATLSQEEVTPIGSNHTC
jgi:hypothetical protein